jgi:hypothetical protein
MLVFKNKTAAILIMSLKLARSEHICHFIREMIGNQN